MNNSPRPVTDDELRKELPLGWEVVEVSGIKKLRKTYELTKYSSGIDLVIKLAGLADTMDHHPDILLGYRVVKVEIYTHTIEGISALDLQFAIAAEKIHLKE